MRKSEEEIGEGKAEPLGKKKAAIGSAMREDDKGKLILLAKAKDVKRVWSSNQLLLILVCKEELVILSIPNNSLPSNVLFLLQEFEDIFLEDVPDG